MRSWWLVLLTLLLLPFSAAGVQVHAEPAAPFAPYHVKPLNGILYPRIGLPALVVNGSEFTVWVHPDLGEPSEVFLSSVFTGKIPLEVTDKGKASQGYYVTVRGSAPSGLYNLTVVAGGKSYTEPNAVAFFDSYRELKVAHWTDTHFGVRDLPKHSMNELLFRTAIGTFNSMDLDLILHTGDVIDAIVSKDEEEPFRRAYEELVTLRHPIIMCEGNNDYTAIEKKAYYWEKYFAPLAGYTSFGDLTFFATDSDTGKIFGDQFDVLKTAKGKAGVGLIHYPFDDKDIRLWLKEGNETKIVDYNGTIKYLLDFSHEHGLRLWLVGHWHSDGNWKYGDVEVLLTDAGQYDHGTSYGGPAEDYGHYRLLTLAQDGSYRYEPTTTFWKMNVTFLRVPNASSGSIAFTVSGKSPTELKVPVILSKFNPKPQVSGAQLVEAKEVGGHGYYLLSVKVTPDQRKLVVLQAEPDKEPPELSVKIKESGEEVILFYRAYDRGTGVKEVKAYTSSDNESWNPLEPVIETGWPTFKMPANQSFYYRIEAYDAVGNKAVKYGQYKPEVTEEQAQPAGAGTETWIYGVAVLLLVIILAIGAKRLRRS